MRDFVITCVKQINEYTCVLACLESITVDRGDRITQEEMIKRYPGDCNFEGRKGAISYPVIPKLVQYLGLDFILLEKGTSGLANANQHLHKGGYVLIISHKSLQGEKRHHCLRLIEVKDGEYVKVMDPGQGKIDTWEWKAIDTRGCDIAMISLRD